MLDQMLLFVFLLTSKSGALCPHFHKLIKVTWAAFFQFSVLSRGGAEL